MNTNTSLKTHWIPPNLRISNDNRSEEAKRLEHSDTPLEELFKAVEDNPKTINSVIYNPNATPALLTMALDQRNPYIHKIVARHPNATPELLRRILKESSKLIVGTEIVRHPNCPPDILKRLADKGDQKDSPTFWKTFMSYILVHQNFPLAEVIKLSHKGELPASLGMIAEERINGSGEYELKQAYAEIIGVAQEEIDIENIPLEWFTEMAESLMD